MFKRIFNLCDLIRVIFDSICDKEVSEANNKSMDHLKEFFVNVHSDNMERALGMGT